jgi:hypothetical protein
VALPSVGTFATDVTALPTTITPESALALLTGA